MLPRGHYTSFVTATDGTLVGDARRSAFDTDAFRYKLSDTTPGRGQKITVTITSAELLAKISRLYIYQPGVARWSVSADEDLASHTYKATFRLKSSGPVGTVRFKVSGTRHRGGSQSTTVASFPIH